MKKWIQQILPPDKWKLPVTIIVGFFVGLGVFVFIESNAVSYLNDKPETCINCHVMNSQYASWQHSSHREVATCNDCHVPHNNVVNKYFFKAKDGMRHASMFTLRLEPQVIRIKSAGQKVVQDNCVRCHENLLEDRSMLAVVNSSNFQTRTERHCWECHQETPHGSVSSLAAFPNALVKSNENPVAKWLQNSLNTQKTQKK